MSLADDEKWMLPETLRRQEKEVIAAINEGAPEDELGDFGAYYGLLTGKNLEAVKPHSISDERYLASYSRQMRALLHMNRGESRGRCSMSVAALDR